MILIKAAVTVVVMAKYACGMCRDVSADVCLFACLPALRVHSRIHGISE